MKQTHRPPRSIYPAQNRHMRRRTRVLAGLVAVLCFGGLLARLFTLQILDPSGYANRAAAQQLRDTTLPAARGEIYSADYPGRQQNLLDHPGLPAGTGG